MIFLHWLVSAFSLLATAYLMPGFKVDSFISALIASLVIGIANIIIWPILMLLTLPINIISLGLFTFVVNGIVLKICAGVLPGFSINGIFAAIFGSIVLSLVSGSFHYIFV